MNYLLLILIFIPTLFTQIIYYYKFKKLESKCDLFLENKAEEVIYTLRSEIPMGETFLRGALLEKIKTKAKNIVLSGFIQFKQQLTESKELKMAIILPWAVAFLTALLAFFLL